MKKLNEICVYQHHSYHFKELGIYVLIIIFPLNLWVTFHKVMNQFVEI